MNEIQRKFVDKKVTDLLNSRCIVKMPHFDPTGFLSNIFLVPKKEKDSFRMILNLKHLNKYVQTPHFKMESIKDVQRLVQKNFWICTCDIKDAYPHFLAQGDQQKLLQFVRRNQVYAFCTMPQGLANAPYVFTRICKQIAKYLRSQGVLCVFYIDDVIVVGSSFEQCQPNLQLVLSTLQGCGFLINWDKSQLIPAQTASVLGFVIDARDKTISLDCAKRLALQKTFLAALHSSKVKIKKFARWIGLCISILLCFPQGKLHYRHLEWSKLAALCVRGFKWGKTMTVSPHDKMTLTWWLKIVNNNKPHVFQIPPVSLTMSSDASLLGWWICFDSGELTGFRFSADDMLHPINTKELLAIYYGLQTFHQKIAGHHLLIKSDSMTALVDMRKMGSMCNLFQDQLICKIYKLLYAVNTKVSLNFIPGVQNVLADEKSRVFTSETSEWSLPQEIFKTLQDIAPEMEVDLFASHLNNKLPLFCS